MEQGPVQTQNEGPAVKPKFGSAPFNPNGGVKGGGMTETAPVNPGGEMREMKKKLAMQRNQGMKTRAAQKR